MFHIKKTSVIFLKNLLAGRNKVCNFVHFKKSRKMTHKKANIQELDQVVIRLSGDSGDGMQLIGTLFSDTAAFSGNDLATFPDFPAEIRAPLNTAAGV